MRATLRSSTPVRPPHSQEGRSGSAGHVVNIVMIEGTALAQRDLKTQNAAAVPLGLQTQRLAAQLCPLAP